MARRKGGMWLPLDVGFFEDDKVIQAGEKAQVLYLSMALACKRHATDGVLTVRQIDRLHVTGWKGRLATLVDVELVAPWGEDSYALTGWYQHNDPVALVEARRAADAARKQKATPNGIRTESAPTPDVEKRREEKSREAAPPDSAPCPHGADHSGLCALCRVAREAGSG